MFSEGVSINLLQGAVSMEDGMSVTVDRKNSEDSHALSNRETHR